MLRRLDATNRGPCIFSEGHQRSWPTVYADIREELASQYLLAYESSSTRRNGAWRRVAVRVNRPSVTARTRRGYFAPTQVADVAGPEELTGQLLLRS